MIVMVRLQPFLQVPRQWHGIEWNASERGISCQIFFERSEYLLTSLKSKDAGMSARKPDIPIVVMKQGNSCGAKFNRRELPVLKFSSVRKRTPGCIENEHQMLNRNAGKEIHKKKFSPIRVLLKVLKNNFQVLHETEIT